MPQALTAQAPRQGPRPLPLHLLSANLTLMSSLAALPSARLGSLAWNPALAAAVKDLTGALAAAPPEALLAAVGAEIERRLAEMLAGIQRYRDHPYRRSLADPPTLMVEGGSRVLDYGAGSSGAGGGGVPVLFVPSLVNRGYVLDLSARRSMLRYLAAQGIRPWLLEWGSPGAIEHGYAMTDYIAGRLSRVLDRVVTEAGGPVGLVGYCMGGDLTLAAALLRPDAVTALALLATPWDFSAGQQGQGLFFASLRHSVAATLAAFGEMPVDALQTFFLSLDPQLGLKKFIAFARMDPASEQAEDFVALEDWLNDGIPLAAKVAEECLVGWYGDNLTARGDWRIAGEAVAPERWRKPCLVVVPETDRIVPPASAAALARAIPGARTLTPPSGHIGMVVGSRGEAGLWRPLAEWLKTHVAKAAPAPKRRAGRRRATVPKAAE